MVYLRYFIFFFFQAEDGIRDTSVTGVQTCALPIWLLGCCESMLFSIFSTSQFLKRFCDNFTCYFCAVSFDKKQQHRSEERRVGKECRYQWRMCIYKKQQNSNTESIYKKTVAREES